MKSENFLQTSRSTKAASRESREPDSESRQLDSTVSSVRDTESSVKNTESSVRSTTGRVSRQESTSTTTGRASNRNTAPNRDSKGQFEGFHSKFQYKSLVTKPCYLSNYKKLKNWANLHPKWKVF